MSTAIATKLLVVGPDDNGLLMTLEDFDKITEYDENYRYELINGVLIVNPIPGHAERDPNEELGHLLRSYQEQQSGILNKTLFEEYVQMSHRRRRADRIIWAGLGMMPNFKTDVPTIVVEFVSQSRRDRHRDYVLQRDKYLELGIKEYWIIDRLQRTMTVFRPAKKGPKKLIVGKNDAYRTPLLPDF
jgi:Uma2 family endonuclease